MERKGNGRVGEVREGKGGDGIGKDRRGGREERGMGACTRWDFRKSAPMILCQSVLSSLLVLV